MFNELGGANEPNLGTESRARKKERSSHSKRGSRRPIELGNRARINEKRVFTVSTIARMVELEMGAAIELIVPTEPYPVPDSIAAKVGDGLRGRRRKMSLSGWHAFLTRAPQSTSGGLAFTFDLPVTAIESLKVIARRIATEPSRQHDPKRRSGAFLKEAVGRRQYRGKQVDNLAPALPSHESERSDAEEVFEKLMASEARGGITWPTLDRVLHMTNRSNSEIRMHNWEDVRDLSDFLRAAGISAKRCRLTLVSLPEQSAFQGVCEKVCMALNVGPKQVTENKPFRRCSKRKEFGVITGKVMTDVDKDGCAKAASGWKCALFVSRVVMQALSKNGPDGR